MTELVFRSATSLASAIRAHEIGSREICSSRPIAALFRRQALAEDARQPLAPGARPVRKRISKVAGMRPSGRPNCSA